MQFYSFKVLSLKSKGLTINHLGMVVQIKKKLSEATPEKILISGHWENISISLVVNKIKSVQFATN